MSEECAEWREFEITFKCKLKAPGQFDVSESAIMLNRQNEIMSFPAKFKVIEYGALVHMSVQYAKLKDERIKVEKERDAIKLTLKNAEEAVLALIKQRDRLSETLKQALLDLAIYQ